MFALSTALLLQVSKEFCFFVEVAFFAPPPCLNADECASPMTSYATLLTIQFWHS